MKQLKTIIVLLMVAIAIAGFKTTHTAISFNDLIQAVDTSKWEAPASANSLVNPISVNEETLADGALVYKKTCRSCHGRNGDGKGIEAADLSTAVTDFTNPDVFEQSDGSLFWKTAEGRNDMLPLKDDLSEEEIWSVVNYIKTFAQPSEE